jgi:large subunit ribosomal protein L19e
MAADVMKVGYYRVAIVKPEEAIQAMTKDDVRALIKKGAIIKKAVKPASKVRARKTLAQKQKGRRKGFGTKKGKIGGRIDSKTEWMKKVRALRKELKHLKPKMNEDAYRKLYRMIKGSYFRNKSHLKLYMTEKKLWKEKTAATAKK